MLTAGDAHVAEDLVQTTLIKVYLRWGRIRGQPGAYARRVLVNAFIDHRRVPFVRSEDVTETLPEVPATEGKDAIDPELLAALSRLPERMRAAVVLRHVQDLSVAETAAVLGCSTGTVKSQTARGIDRLRVLLAHSDDHPPPSGRTATTSPTLVATSTGDRHE